MTISTVAAIPTVALWTFLVRFFTDFDTGVGISRIAARAIETIKGLLKPDSDWGPASKLQNAMYQDHLEVRKKRMKVWTGMI